MTVALDPVAARAVARGLSMIGDSLYDQAFAWRTRLGDLDLVGHGFASRRALEESAEELWRNAAFLTLTADRLTDADSTPLDAADLWRLASGVEGRHGAFGVVRDLLGASPDGGDLGGVFDGELRRPLHVFGTDPVSRARSLVGRLLADLSDPMQIRQDEFAVVQLADDRYIVVLPGVTDLSSPDLFLSDEHRSVRDLDQYAVPSSRSSSVDDNRYASLVWEALRARGVPDGSELMLVGHSFGADTALDLAADPTFNGEQYTVTHVVAAGYHSQPQLPDVIAGTDVLVLQNNRDAAVIVEGLGHSNAAGSVTERANALSDALRFDVVGAVGHVVDAVRHDAGTVVDAGGFLVDHADELADITLGTIQHDWTVAQGAALDLLVLDPGVRRNGDHVIDVFEGGGDGVGHHPTNYIDHVADVDHPEVVAFLASISAQGYDADGALVAVDVSVPES